MRAAIAILLLIGILLPALPACLYLAVLTVTAPFGARRRVARTDTALRFAVLVPAHNEQGTVGRLIDSLKMLDYPRESVDICVVADNCTDATSAVARARGALVFERDDQTLLGKGYALQWLLDELERCGRRYDAYVVLDADSVVSPNFLSAMCGRLDAGARVVQAYYAVLMLHGTRGELLREAALAPLHYLRPAAKMALGASCGLKGNGMCFDRTVIERFGWPCAGLAEDVEFHLALVAAGIRVVFAPEAVVRAEMPASLGGAHSQNLRWEAGRLATVRHQAAPLLLSGLRRRNVAAIDAAIEQLVPPLSLPIALSAVGLIGGALLRAPAVWLTAMVMLAILATYVVAGLALARVSLRVYGAIIHVPVYVGWKLALYARALCGPRERRWVRTERAGEASVPAVLEQGPSG